jgi:xanthine dehydrogenase accessory factor
MSSIATHEQANVAVNQWPDWPAYGLVDDLRPTLAHWAARGETAAIATLVSITGSSPRPLGSEMAIAASGDVAGYVSGGCVEGAVAAEARGVIETGTPVLLDYGAGSPVLDVQLTCGGRIGIFVRAIPDLAAYTERLCATRDNREALDVVIDLETGAHRFEQEAEGTEAAANGHTFRKTYLPLPRLIVIGSDPVTLALCRLAPQFGFELGLLRPYGPAAPPAGAPTFHYDTRPLARALEELPIDTSTAIYTLTHNMDDDQVVLGRALRSPAFAVGVLGSRRKIVERATLLREEAGLGDAELERLSTPAGLDIGAQNPTEIALSMLAELVARRPRAGRPPA